MNNRTTVHLVPGQYLSEIRIRENMVHNAEQWIDAENEVFHPHDREYVLMPGPEDPLDPRMRNILEHDPP